MKKQKEKGNKSMVLLIFFQCMEYETPQEMEPQFLAMVHSSELITRDSAIRDLILKRDPLLFLSQSSKRASPLQQKYGFFFPVIHQKLIDIQCYYVVGLHFCII
ncbi:hypothetical protein ACFX13_037181 [Malus domestica]